MKIPPEDIVGYLCGLNDFYCPACAPDTTGSVLSEFESLDVPKRCSGCGDYLVHALTSRAIVHLFMEAAIARSQDEFDEVCRVAKIYDVDLGDLARSWEPLQ